MTNVAALKARNALRYECTFMPRDYFEAEFYSVWLHWLGRAHVSSSPTVRARCQSKAAWARGLLVSHRLGGEASV